MRVKDIDFDRNQITVWRDKGDKYRLTMLPAAVRADLWEHRASGTATRSTLAVATALGGLTGCP